MGEIQSFLKVHINAIIKQIVLIQELSLDLKSCPHVLVAYYLYWNEDQVVNCRYNTINACAILNCD